MVSLAHSQRLCLRTCAAACVLIATLSFTFSANTAYACTPPPGGLPSYTTAQRVAAADIVVLGTVQSVATEFVPGDTATIAVEQYFKGSGPQTITVKGYGPGSFCRSEVGIGQRLIFFIRNTNTGLQANYLSQFDAVLAPSEQIIAELKTLQRPNIFLPLLMSTQPRIAEAPQPRTAIFPWLIVTLATGLVAVVVWRSRSH